MTARLAAIGTAYRKLHAAVETPGTVDADKFLSWLTREALRRFDRFAAADIVPSGEQLMPPASELKSQFNRAMHSLWVMSAALGVEFEANAVGSARAEQAFAGGIRQDGYPDIRIQLGTQITDGIRKYLADRQVGIWGTVTESVRTALSESIQAGIKEGLGVRDIRKRVVETLGVTRDRAIVIARTEATAGLNSGQQLLRDEEGITHKIWLDTSDGLTRPTHVAAGDQSVANADPFVVGGYKMRHPGDGSLGAPASEIVNCRCCATGDVKDAPPPKAG